MAYSPAVRGHRDKFASSGRNLNTAAIVNGKNREKSTSGSTGYAENTNGYSDNYIKENGGVPGSGNTDNADNGSNQPQSLEDYSHSNSVKLPGGKTSCRANMNSNGDNAQAYGEPQKSTARRVSQNGSNADQMNETHGPNNYPHSYSPGSNSGKFFKRNLKLENFDFGKFAPMFCPIKLLLCCYLHLLNVINFCDRSLVYIQFKQR